MKIVSYNAIYNNNDIEEADEKTGLLSPTITADGIHPHRWAEGGLSYRTNWNM